MQIVKQPSLMESRFTVTALTELDALDAYRALLSLIMMLLLERNRG